MLRFTPFDLKTDEILEDLPTKNADHTYLEAKLKLVGRLDDPTLGLYTAKLYEGVTEADIARQEARGIYLMCSSEQNAYFADRETVAMVDDEMLQNFSDTVAYGSVIISEAGASTISLNARVLVIDDEAETLEAALGSTPLVLKDETPVDPNVAQAAVNAMGDSFSLVEASLQRELIEQQTIAQLQVNGAIVETFTLTAETTAGVIDVASTLQQQIRSVVPDRLWHTSVIQKSVEPNIAYDDLEQFSVGAIKLHPDGTGMATWEYAIESSNAPKLQGQARLRPLAEGGYRLDVLGSTAAQQPAFKQAMNSMVQAQDTPFQFRAGVPEWQGVIKGECRGSDLCRQLEVEAIIPRSSIKGDGKTVAPGLYTVKQLFWARKAAAKTREQNLGSQVLVNLPESTQTDIAPKVKAALDTLNEARKDPRLVADLYLKHYEKRQELLAAQEFGEETGNENSQQDEWAYTVLKTDVRPITVITGLASEEFAIILEAETWQRLQDVAAQGLEIESFVKQANAVLDNDELTIDPELKAVYRFTVEKVLNPTNPDVTYPTIFSTQQRGGYSQLLEHEKIVDKLEEFIQKEYRETALGGITVPSAIAQPHYILQPNEICFTGMPHGAEVCIYRSPVANVSAFRVITNNLTGIKQNDSEAFRQKGVIYLNRETAKELLIDFDGDPIAMIPALELQKVKTIPGLNLKANEVFVPSLPDGQTVTLYHSGDQVTALTNNLAAGQRRGFEAPTGRVPTVYVPLAIQLDPDQPVQMGYYDGLHGFQGVHQEVIRLNAPENRPVQTEKERKIPRNANDPSLVSLTPAEQAMARRFTTKASAALDAANNPTGMIANIGMSLEALRTEIRTLTDEEKEPYLQEIHEKYGSLLKRTQPNTDDKRPIAPPPSTANYNFMANLKALAAGQSRITAQDPAKRLAQVEAQLQQVEQFLFQVEGLNAVNLQRGVDTPKSARVVDLAIADFCKATCYKKVAWVTHKKDLNREFFVTHATIDHTDSTEGILTSGARTMPNNTRDAVGQLLAYANDTFTAERQDRQKNSAFDHLLPTPTTATPEAEALIAKQISVYNSSIAQAAALDAKAATEKGPSLFVETPDGTLEVTNLTRFDTEGKSPLWDAVRAGIPLELTIIENDKLGIDKSWETEKTHLFAVQASLEGKGSGVIGTLSNASVADLAETLLKRHQSTKLHELKIKHKGKPPARELIRECEFWSRGLTEWTSTPVTGQLVHNGDKEEAKAIRSLAGQERQAWAESIPPEDREYWAQLAWSCRGQAFALATFPDVVNQQLETFQFPEATLLGLQYEDWESVDWNSGQVPVRVVMGTTKQHDDPTEVADYTKRGHKTDPHYGKPLLQAQTPEGEWKLIATLSSADSEWHLPLGLEAQATIKPHPTALLVEIPRAMLRVMAPHPSLAPTGEGEAVPIQFRLEGGGKNIKGYIADLQGRKLGELDQNSIAALKEKELTLGKFFNARRKSDVKFHQDPKAPPTMRATLILDPATVTIPEVWSKRHPEEWQKTLEQTGEEPGQMISTPVTERQGAVQTQTETSSPNPVNEVLQTKLKLFPRLVADEEAATQQATATQRQATQPTTAPTAALTTPKATNLDHLYQQASTRISTILETVGQRPTARQIDLAIAAEIYRCTPDLGIATERLKILSKSTNTQNLYQSGGFEAANAYVNSIALTAYQQVHQPTVRSGKSIPTER